LRRWRWKPAKNRTLSRASQVYGRPHQALLAVDQSTHVRLSHWWSRWPNPKCALEQWPLHAVRKGVKKKKHSKWKKIKKKL
jgi:hypothetical protein